MSKLGQARLDSAFVRRPPIVRATLARVLSEVGTRLPLGCAQSCLKRGLVLRLTERDRYDLTALRAA